MDMKYDILGRTDDKASTVMLSAGLGGLGHFWRPQIDALTARHRVIVYDQRGTGSNAGELPDDYSIAHMAGDVVAVLDDAGIPSCHFVGHALGGLVGLELARRDPSRMASLVLVNAWPRVDCHTRRCFDARTALLKHVGVEAYVRAQPIFLYPAPWLSEHEDAVRKEEAMGIAHFQGANNLLKRLSALLAFDVTSSLEGIHTPAFVAASRDDVLVPYTCSQQLADGLPNGTLWMTAEGGHAFTATDPAPFNAAMLAFLAEKTP
jgi:aminoacrylate hydrolase